MKQVAISLLLLSLSSLSPACLLPEERGLPPAKIPTGGLTTRQTSAIPIGTGDRFNGGATAPQGLGTRATGTSFTTQLSAAEVTSGLAALAKAYNFPTFTAPYKTYEGRSIVGGRVGGVNGGTCNDAYHVYLNGNIHARERGSADGLLYFISDLLYANKTGSGLTYGGKSYTNAQVKTALGTGIVFVPLSNPDGVAWDQSTGSCWRKNRNPASSTTGVPASIGVDLNRNFDFLWDFAEEFAASEQDVASESPRSEVFHGMQFSDEIPGHAPLLTLT